MRDPVSNVDLAPTFCRLAGCRMGGADGRDLTRCWMAASSAWTAATSMRRCSIRVRNAVREGVLPGTASGRRSATPRRYWVYTEYASGERELYDLPPTRTS